MHGRYLSHSTVSRMRKGRVSRKAQALLALGLAALLTLGAAIGSEFQISQASPGNRYEPRVAYDSLNHRYLVVWRHYNGSDNDVRAQIVQADGTVDATVFPENAIADSSDYERYPDLAYSPHEREHLVVYTQELTVRSKRGTITKQPHVVRAQRVASDGQDSGAPFDISPLYWDTVTHSRVAYNTASQNYLVVWEVAERVGKGRKAPRGVIYGARVDIDLSGNVSIGEVKTYAAGGYDTDCGELDLAANPDTGEFLVVFPSCLEHPHKVAGRLASGVHDGEPLGSGPFVIASEPGLNLDARSLAYGSGEYLVVFEGAAVRGRRVSSTGEPQGSEDGGFVVTIETGDGGMGVEYNGTSNSFLVVWSFDSTDDGVLNREIHGREVMLDGSMPAGPFTISAGTDNKIHPALAFNSDQSQFLVAWSDAGTIRGVRWALGE